MITISRRRFLALTGGVLATGCTAAREADIVVPSPTTAGTSPTTTSTVPGVVTSVSSTEPAPFGNNVLVLVELRGGNDAVNTLPPLTGAYRDLRPTIALPETDLVMSEHFGPHGLHPSLAPLLDLADAASERRGRCLIAGPETSLKTVLDITRVSDRLEIHDEVASATRVLR